MAIKKSILFSIIIFLSATQLSAQQEDIIHKNGNIAYDVSFGAVYFSNKKQAFFKRYKNFYYAEGIKAYEPRYKNVYYSDGAVAYNNLNKNIYYQNGTLAYNPKEKVVYDDKGQVKLELKSASDKYTFEDENLKIHISEFTKYEFELTMIDEDFTYVTNFSNYFKILENGTNKILAKITF